MAVARTADSDYGQYRSVTLLHSRPEEHPGTQASEEAAVMAYL